MLRPIRIGTVMIVVATLLSACGGESEVQTRKMPDMGEAPKTEPAKPAEPTKTLTLADKGRKVFAKCKACHTVNGKVKVGPPLNGVINRKVGAHEEALSKNKYSKAMTAIGETGLLWDAALIKAYITGKPNDWLKLTAETRGLDCAVLGNCRGKMAFSGVRKARDRDALLAYLESL